MSKIEVELGNAQGEIGKSFEQAGFGMQELQVVIEGVRLICLRKSIFASLTSCLPHYR